MPFLEGRNYQPDALERRVLALWREQDTFRESIRQRDGSPPFVFLEGPPTANGLPHPGHVLTRTLKDAVCRYKTMRGFQVERKAGWDCHGLPVEIEVEKELGLQNKQDIERYGVAAFNAKCRESVFRYKKEWEAMSERVGFWLDFQNPYVTLENPYIESVWWSLQQAWKKGLLYQGFRVAAYCPRCGTGLSSHEVGLGYKSVEEPSVFVKFRLRDQPGASVLAWTTTPWTLPGNVALAVGEDITYVEVEAEGRSGPERYYLAKDLLSVLRPGHKVVRELAGREMLGWNYEPLYAYTRDVLERAQDPAVLGQIEGVNLGWALGRKPDREEHPERRWTLVAADFVTTTDGTGVVHTAVMYGEDDYELGMRLGLPAVHTVDAEGKFKPFVTKFAGKFVKAADADIIEDLRERDLLYRVKNHTHDYPFCWRCSTPLLYYARNQWFIRMSQERGRLVDFNQRVQWVPGHVKEGRFGDFIRNVRDWALSRDRYWGTPLPIWTCRGCQHRECVGSIEELRRLGGEPVERLVREGKLDLHKPAVDEIRFRCPKCSENMERDPNVIDTWYDSGAASFAQWHYPFDPEKKHLAEAPVDFITEGIDQTRGWFYTLLAESTFLFDREAYRSVVVAGLILDEKGFKMSKSKKNYTDPNLIFQEYGADAMRWNLLSSSVTADKRFFAGSIRETYTRFFLTLWNTYQFFRGYTELDGWKPGSPAPAHEHRPPLDRWLLERLGSVAAVARAEADAYNLHKATQAIESFLVDDVSNWWVRRSRRRFWGEAPTQEKASAYATLYDALAGLVVLAAPYAPFLTEALYQDLRAPQDPRSVHFLPYPQGLERRQETELEREMRQVRALTEAARALRSKAGVKTRIPLRRITLVRSGAPSATLRALLPILEEEANVKEVVVGADAAGLEDFEARPDRAKIGRDLKTDAKPVLEETARRDPRQLGQELRSKGSVTIAGRELPAHYFVVTTIAKEGTLKADVGPDTLFLDATLTRELEDEGWAREVTRRVQEMRKDVGLELNDQIEVAVVAEPAILEALRTWKDHVSHETRARSLHIGGTMDHGTPREWDIDGEKVTIAVRKVPV